MTLGVLLLSAGAMVARRKLHRRPPPNVVFVVMDTVRSDHASLCGYERPTTPNLEQLVKLGATYTCGAYAPGSWTLPSHASFFTGVDVATHRVDFTSLGSHEGKPLFEPDNLVNPLGPDLPTLAELFQKRGYRTVAVSANPVIRPAMGLTRGFDQVRTADQFGQLYRGALAPAVDEALGGPGADHSRPLFLFVNISDAHTPWYDVPEGAPWLAPQEGIKDYFSGGDRSPWAQFVTGALDAAAKKRLEDRTRDLYDQALSHADANLGALIAVLEKRGWAKPGLRLIVTSDHGEFLGEHGLLDHGHYVYEPNNRVPFVYWETGRRLDLPTPMSAISAFDLALGDASRLATTPVVASAYPGRRWIERSKGAVGGSSSVAIWAGHTKLMWMDGRTSKYDLHADPLERSPASADGDPLLPSLEAHVKRFSAPVAASPMSPEMLERLRSLGYVK